MNTDIPTLSDARPQYAGLDRAKLAQCVQACFESAQTCTACVDTCLSEDMAARLTVCIRINLDCVDACVATGKILSRHRGREEDVTRAVVEACRAVCRACADTCALYASMREHCRVCADACRRCEQACSDLLTTPV